RVREDERALARARGSRRAHRRGGCDGKGAARRHDVRPGRHRAPDPRRGQASACDQGRGRPRRRPARGRDAEGGGDMSDQTQGHEVAYLEPEKIKSIDAEFLAGHRFPYQEDMSLVVDVDLDAATPGQDINWLEDIHLLEEDGVPAVFDRYSNS